MIIVLSLVLGIGALFFGAVMLAKLIGWLKSNGERKLKLDKLYGRGTTEVEREAFIQQFPEERRDHLRKTMEEVDDDNH